MSVYPQAGTRNEPRTRRIDLRTRQCVTTLGIVPEYQFQISRGETDAIVSGGDTFWWESRIGANRWTGVIMPDTPVDYPETGYRAIYLQQARSMRESQLDTTTIEYEDSANYRTYIMLIGVIGSDRSIEQLYVGGPIYTRDDPPILSVQPFFTSLDEHCPTDPPDGWEYLSAAGDSDQRLLFGVNSGGGVAETGFGAHTHTISGIEPGASIATTDSGGNLGNTRTVAFIRKL
jgi:hypothetical protein